MNQKGDTAVIVIDLQRCFLPGGSLATDSTNSDNGEQLSKNTSEFIKKLKPEFLFISLDWHPEGHISFGKPEELPEIPGTKTTETNVYENIKKRLWSDGRTEDAHKKQILWPAHCIQKKMEDSGVAESFDINNIQKTLPMINIKYVLKGFQDKVDSYSVVADAVGEPTPYIYTGTYESLYNNYNPELIINNRFLTQLENSKINNVYLTGIARNVCVYWSAMDLLEYWILPKYFSSDSSDSVKKIIKLFFVYNLTRPVMTGDDPMLDIKKDIIEKNVKDLITKYKQKHAPNNNDTTDTIFKNIFQIIDSTESYGFDNEFFGGSRKTRKHKSSKHKSSKNKNKTKSRKTRKHKSKILNY
jgi:nicotinamidase-related amidase